MPGVEERIRARLEDLAGAVGIPAPPLVVVPQPEIGQHPVPAWVVGRLRPKRIAVTVPLVVASPAEQNWYLASCLAWWVSPAPRCRRRLALAVVLAVGAALAVVYVPGWPQHGVWSLLADQATFGAIALLAGAWSHRWPRRAMEEVGLEVLAAAGRDPAVVAREAFGDATPSGLAGRLLSALPDDGDRIASADGWAPRPAPPLH